MFISRTFKGRPGAAPAAAFAFKATTTPTISNQVNLLFLVLLTHMCLSGKYDAMERTGPKPTTFVYTPGQIRNGVLHTCIELYSSWQPTGALYTKAIML